MKPILMVALVLIATLAVTAGAAEGALPGVASRARTLQVGPTRTYTKPSLAAAAALDGDTIEIDAGLYSGDVCFWTKNNLILRGVGSGRARLDAAGQNAGGKAIWVIQGANTTVENIEFFGESVVDQNGAGIRQEGAGLTVRNCYFHDNDDGILTNAGATSDILIEYSEFDHNGFGDGFSHNMYIGNVRSFTLQYCYSHNVKVGHLVKSRAQVNNILYNRITCETTGSASYEIDMPNGGQSFVIGNLIEQGPNQQNPTLLNFAEEGATNTVQELYVVNNTFVNDYTSGTFVHVSGTPAQSKLINNIFAGPGTVLSGVGTQTTNLVSNTPGFVNAGTYDYHLMSSSPAINAGSNPGTAGAMSLIPQFVYVDPISQTTRPVDAILDIGAYEFGAGNPANQAPTVTTPASASPNPVMGTTTSLSVLGADDAGEPGLKYSWVTTGAPPAGVNFSANNSNGAKATTATFTKAGTYTIQATIKDAGNLSATSSVVVTVNATLTSVVVTPASVVLKAGDMQAFAANGRDQFGNATALSTGVTWSASGGGTIDSSGKYLATGPFGSYTITGVSGALSATASVTIPNLPPSFLSTASAMPSPAIVGETISFSAAASDPDNDSLTYAWNFGDAAMGQGAAVTHAYTAVGVYNVSVTVSDGVNPAVTQTFSVMVGFDPLNFAVKINFQPSNAPIPSGYLADYGAAFGDRGAGLQYGWNNDNSLQMRDRNAANSPDQRYDSLALMQSPQNPNAVWEIAVPSGTYRVRAVCGDPIFCDSSYRLTAENVPLVSGDGSAAMKWFEGTEDITVTDGRLTLSIGSGAINNKLAFVEITSSALPAVLDPVVPVDEGMLTVTKLHAAVNFKKAGKDSVQVSARIATVNSPQAAGTVAFVDVGGASQSFLLSAKGSARSKTGTLALKRDKKTGDLLISATLKGALWQGQLQDAGLRNQTVKKVAVQIPVTVSIGGQTFSGVRAAVYTAVSGRSGAAK